MEISTKEYEELMGLGNGSPQRKLKDKLDKQYELKKFLKAIYQDIDFSEERIRVLEVSKDNNYSNSNYFSDIDDMVGYSINKYRKFNNMYFSLSSTNGVGGKEEDLLYRYCLGFDFDKKDFDKGFSHKDVAEKFKRLGLWYHCIVDSGNGFHTYMMIEKTFDLDKVDKVQNALAELLGADMKANLKTQILRIPYSFNVKDKLKEVKIIHQFEKKTIKRYKINQLYNRFCQSNFREDSSKPLYINNNIPKCVEKALNEGSKVGNRNNDLFNIVIALKHRGDNLTQVKYAIDIWNSKNEKPLGGLSEEVERVFSNYNGYLCNSCSDEIKLNCKKYTISDFDLEKYGQPIISIMNKVAKQCRKPSRKGVNEMNGNELFVYNVLVNNQGFLNMDIDKIMELITDRKTKKSALSKPTLLKSLKGLEDKGFIEIIKGNTRQGIKDNYKVIEKKVTIENSFKMSYFANILVIKGHISTTELRVYTHMRYLHLEDVKLGKAKGNIFIRSLDDLAKSLGDSKSNVSRYVNNLYENMVLDRRAIQKESNSKQFYYEYKLNM